MYEYLDVLNKENNLIIFFRNSTIYSMTAKTFAAKFLELSLFSNILR